MTNEITLDQLAARFQQIVTHSGPAAANTALEVIRQMLNFAIQRGWTSNNVAAVLKPFPKASRERVATEEELGRIWRALEFSKSSGRSDSIACTLCLQLCLLTLQRRGEVAGIQFQEVDWKAKLWTIPGPRTKNKKGPHAVPLSDLAIEILNQAFAGRGSGFAFAGKVVEYPLLGIAHHYVDGDVALLSESPDAARTLIELLVTVVGEKCHMCAVLPVQTERADLRLGDEALDFAGRKGE
jgi:integrase